MSALAFVKDPITGRTKRTEEDPLRPSIRQQRTGDIIRSQGSEFTRGLRRGVQTVKSAARGTVAAGAAVLGADEFAEEQARIAQAESENVARVSPKRVARVEDIRTFDDAVDFAAAVSGEALPTVAASIGGGVAGQVIRRGALGAGIGAAGVGTTLEGGNTFQEAAAERLPGTSLREAALVSLGSGVVGGGLEAAPIFLAARRLGLDGPLRDSVQRGLASRVARGAGEQAGAEAATEAAQTVVSRSARHILNENVDVLGDEGVSELLNAAVAGAIVGGGLGGLTGIPSHEQRLESRDAEIERFAGARLDRLRQKGAPTDDIAADGFFSGDDLSRLNSLEVKFAESSERSKAEKLLRGAAREGPDTVTSDDALLVQAIADGSLREALAGTLRGQDPATVNELTQLKIDEAVTELRERFPAIDEVLGTLSEGQFEQRVEEEALEDETLFGDNQPESALDNPALRDALQEAGINPQQFETTEEDVSLPDEPFFGDEPEIQDAFFTPDEPVEARIRASRKLKSRFFDPDFNDPENSDLRELANLQNLDDGKVRTRISAAKAVQDEANERFGVGAEENDAFLRDRALEQFNSLPKSRKRDFDIDEVLEDPLAFLDQFEALEVRRQNKAVRADVESSRISEDALFAKPTEEEKSAFTAIRLGIENLERNIENDSTALEALDIPPDEALRTAQERADRQRASLEAAKKRLEDRITERSIVRKRNLKGNPFFIDVTRDGKKLSVFVPNLVRATAGITGDKIRTKRGLAKAFAEGLMTLVEQGFEFDLESLSPNTVVFQNAKGVRYTYADIQNIVRGVQPEGVQKARAKDRAKVIELLDAPEAERAQKFADLFESNPFARRALESLAQLPGSVQSRAKAELERIVGEEEAARMEFDTVVRFNDKTVQRGANEPLFDFIERIIGSEQIEGQQAEGAVVPEEARIEVVHIPAPGPSGPQSELLNVLDGSLVERLESLEVPNRAKQDKRLLKLWAAEFGIKNVRIISAAEAAQRLIDAGKVSDARRILERKKRGAAFSNTDKSIDIMIHPELQGAMRIEVLAHEFGHVLFKREFDSAAPGVKTAITKAYDAWRKANSNKLMRRVDVVASKKAFANAKRLLQMSADNKTTIGDLTDDQRADLFDFEEWFADQISRALTTRKKAESKVAQFFSKLAKKIRALFELARSEGYVAHKSVASFVRALSARQGAQRERIRTLADDQRAAIVIEDPFSSAAHEVIKLAVANLSPANKRILARAFFSNSGMRVTIKNLLGERAAATDLDSDVLAAIAYGYQFWAGGRIHPGPKTEEVMREVQNAFGFRPLDQQTEDVLVHLRDGILNGDGNGETDGFVVKQVLRDTVLQRATQQLMDLYNKVRPWFESIFFVASGRMEDLNNPAATKIVERLHARVGQQGVKRTYLEARQLEIGRYTNRIAKILNEAGERGVDLKEALALIRNPKIELEEDMVAAQTVRQIRKLLDDLYVYADSRGTDLGRRENYFPRVYDIEHLQANKDRFIAFLGRPVYEADMRGLARKLSDQFGRNISPTEAAEIIYANITEAHGLEDISISDASPGHVPFVRAMNKRILTFIEKGSDQDIADFNEFLSDDIHQTLRVYTEQLVKRTEFGARFEITKDRNELGELFEEAVQFGATKRDLRVMARYVDAIQGTIGTETNQFFTRLFTGTDAPRGQVINPKLQGFYSALLVWQNLRVLGLSTFTSLVDPVGIGVRSSSLRDVWTAFKTGMGEMNAFVRGKPSETRVMAEALGVIDTAMNNEALNWEYGTVYMGTTARKVNDAFFSAILLSQWTRTTRVMAFAAGKQFLKRHAHSPNNVSARYLAELGLSAEDVVLDDAGELLIYTDAEQPGLTPEERARDARVRTAVNRFVNESILRPDAGQRPIWASDPHFTLAFHLKSFMYSFYDRIIRRTTHEANEGNYVPLIFMMTFVPAMVAIDWARDFLRFGPEGSPRKANWDFGDHVWDAAQRSGVTGLPQIYFDAQKDLEYNNGVGPGMFLGPTGDSLGDLSSFMFADESEFYDLWSKQLPAQNIWRPWIENFEE